MKIISVANHKGGVAKTTTCHALGDAFSMMGYRVLMVDLDPQSTLSQACGIRDEVPNLTQMFKGEASIGEVIFDVSSHQGTLHLLAGDIAMAEIERIIPTQPTGNYILEKQLKTIRDHYDLVLIDCPPSLSGLTYNGLIASDGVLVPTIPQINDLRGVNLFLDTIRTIQLDDRLNPKLRLIGVLLTMYDDRLLTHKEAVSLLTTRYPLLENKITRSIRVAEAPSAEQSIITYWPDSNQAVQYTQLAKEVEAWLKSA
jgi:chromosome partitioning protein